MSLPPNSLRRTPSQDAARVLPLRDPRLAWLAARPGFCALWCVGEAREPDEQFVERERYLLVASDETRADDVADLEVRLGESLGRALLRLRATTPEQLANQERMPLRECWDFAHAARLVAGEPRSREALPRRGLGSPQAQAAVELFRSHIELLLRAYPEPYMLRSAVQRGSPIGFPAGVSVQRETRRVFAELTRGIGDAWLLLLGRYAPQRQERLRRLDEHFAGQPLLRALLHHTYGPRPLDTALPEDDSTLWFVLRGLLLDGYLTALRQGGGGIYAPHELPDHLHPRAKGLLGLVAELWSRSHAPRTHRIDALQLQLVIAKLEDRSDDFSMIGAAIRRMSEAEGPTLANPSWDKLRREALSLRTWLPDHARCDARVEPPLPALTRN